MRLRHLSLRQFRNYTQTDIRFGDEDIQLFMGPNGSGKTNLLEAVSVLSITRSCRGRDDDELVQWGQQFYRVTADVLSDNGETQRIEAVCEVKPRKRKAFFLNDVRTQLGGIVGVLPTVTFLPQDLELFTGPPAERRRFLDQLLSQLSSEYLVTLSQYQKFLQQRNALLRRIAAGMDSGSSLDIWDREIASRGASVTLARLELIHTLNLSFPQEMEALGESWNGVELRYERKGVATAAADIQHELLELLRGNRERDIILQSTSTGPHREDWQVWRDARTLPSFASRGQERTAVLALLQLQASYLELRKNEKPVILLDDAFSELDDEHQTLLLSGFSGCQILMTATRVPEMTERMRVIEVEKGSLMPTI